MVPYYNNDIKIISEIILFILYSEDDPDFSVMLSEIMPTMEAGTESKDVQMNSDFIKKMAQRMKEMEEEIAALKKQNEDLLQSIAPSNSKEDECGLQVS